MSYFRGIIKNIYYFCLLPFVDLKTFFMALVLGLVLMVFSALPITLFGFLIGTGIQLSQYVAYLWGISDSNTKLTILVTVLLSVFPTLATLSAVRNLFNSFRKFAKAELKKSNIL